MENVSVNMETTTNPKAKTVKNKQNVKSIPKKSLIPLYVLLTICLMGIVFVILRKNFSSLSLVLKNNLYLCSATFVGPRTEDSCVDQCEEQCGLVPIGSISGASYICGIGPMKTLWSNPSSGSNSGQCQEFNIFERAVRQVSEFGCQCDVPISRESDVFSSYDSDHRRLSYMSNTNLFPTDPSYRQCVQSANHSFLMTSNTVRVTAHYAWVRTSQSCPLACTSHGGQAVLTNFEKTYCCYQPHYCDTSDDSLSPNPGGGRNCCRHTSRFVCSFEFRSGRWGFGETSMMGRDCKPSVLSREHSTILKHEKDTKSMNLGQRYSHPHSDDHHDHGYHRRRRLSDTNEQHWHYYTGSQTHDGWYWYSKNSRDSVPKFDPQTACLCYF